MDDAEVLKVIETVIQRVFCGGGPTPEEFALLSQVARRAEIPELVRRKHARVLRRIGENHENRGDHERAVAYYSRALALDPKVGLVRRLKKLQEGQS